MVDVPEFPVLREADAAECALGKLTAKEALAMSRTNSFAAYVVKWKGETVAWWGYAPPTLVGANCYAWMLSTSAIESAPLMFALASKRILAKLHEIYPTVIVTVDPRHKLSLRWLHWLGFTPHTTMPPFIQLRSTRKGPE